MHCLRQCGIDKLRSTRNETWRWWSENYQENFFWKILLSSHSSEIWGLLTTKFSSKMLQNFLYFMYKKPSIVFSGVFWVFFISSNFTFSLKNALVYVDKYYRWVFNIYIKYSKFWNILIAQTSYFWRLRVFCDRKKEQ